MQYLYLLATFCCFFSMTVYMFAFQVYSTYFSPFSQIRRCLHQNSNTDHAKKKKIHAHTLHSRYNLLFLLLCIHHTHQHYLRKMCSTWSTWPLLSVGNYCRVTPVTCFSCLAVWGGEQHLHLPAGRHEHQRGHYHWSCAGDNWQRLTPGRGTGAKAVTSRYLCVFLWLSYKILLLSMSLDLF